MDKLRIIHTEWSNGWGGQEIRVLSECLGMAGRGHWVGLAGCPEGKLGQRAREAGLAFFPLAMAGPWDARAMLGLGRLLAAQRVDVLHTHSSVDSWVGGLVARLRGVVCLRTRHLSVPVNTNPLNVVYRLPQAVITTGESIRRHLIDDYGLAAERVVSIPTGVDTARFAPRPPEAALAAELGLDLARPVVAIVAVLRSWKRHDLFCQMAASLKGSRPDVQFLIVGDGPGWQRVNGYLDDMGLRGAVIMTGHRADVERILPLCTVCVLCSDAAEGVPQAVLQQMAAERAVAASDAGDVGQVVIDGQTGLLYPAGDLAALERAVGRLLGDAELRQRLGRAGRQLVQQRHSMERMLDQTEAIYAKALAWRAGARP
ncbi:glycosyl transferase group 1 [Desulfarculus baarsii DSM 2075]|uniref:Glycosyl transferase group 1 n=1 Tax=Desulfarculus baarsii (strain ATCC 33931 / DSM 2075 / LMG 7858 / VKM B-1802 / 2st14) TaxID=644282 RepID=E1QEV0_DESB2|nr:glycosyltransferase family 4 protein [Desulfarculus baarsii]ADK84086.1 glycosyl transferase group 1 [Desulfarculus baarsii DSM 2075]